MFLNMVRNRVFGAVRRTLQKSGISSFHQKSFLPTNYLERKNTLLPFSHASRCYTQTDGDRDLNNFLKEEISYEQNNVMDMPQFKDFKVQLNDTVVTLQRKVGNENVEVSFNINDNINVDEEIHADQMNDEEVAMPDIISYPQFSVKITKSNGSTLHFNCMCNTGLQEDETEAPQNEEDEQFELFRFDSVKVYTDSNLSDKVYEAETDTMDGELYSMLMTVLLERGVNGVFVNDLIDLSTAVEHRHYFSFLKSLQAFASSK